MCTCMHIMGPRVYGRPEVPDAYGPGQFLDLRARANDMHMCTRSEQTARLGGLGVEGEQERYPDIDDTGLETP